MFRQARVIHTLDCRVLGEKARHGQGVGLMAVHAHRQRLQAAQQQPAIERAGYRATDVLEKGQPLAQTSVVGEHRAAHHIVVSVEILRCALNHQVDAKLERLLKVR